MSQASEAVAPVTSADDRALDAEVEAWLRANLPTAWVEAIDRDDALALRRARESLDATDWWERLGEARWFFSTWPVEYGGLGFDTDRAAVVNNALRRYKIPRTDNPLGINVSQALLRFGSHEQCLRFLPPIAHQREIWVQLFSEPGAGSDLAGLSTRAVRDGDQWVVNGQKVWSSWAHTSHWGFLLARTDPDVPKHQGLSIFLLDMQTPGITIRPLRQLTGEAFFNEVFFDDVVIPDARRVGELGQGWKMASNLLTYERGAGVGGGSAAPSMHVGRTVDALMKKYAPIADAKLRERLAVAFSREQIAAWTRLRIEGQRRAGRPTGQEASVLKLFHSLSSQALQTLSLDLEGINAVAHVDDDRWASTTQYGFLRVRSATIAGGTSEIQRNILGEKVLGLPREPVVDRDVPWSQVLRS